MQKKISSWILYLYGTILFILNAIRIFDNNFWGDEAFSIALSHMNFVDMLQATAADVHPPLYYAILQIGFRLLGNHGFVYHLVSLIPYLIVIVFAMTKFAQKAGPFASMLFITFASILDTSVIYNVEVRMYSWGALFILLSFCKLYDIFNYSRTRDFALFSVFSLMAAYTHYYCLVSVAFFYVVLLIFAVIKDHGLIKKTLLTYGITIICYLPWFVVLLITFGRTLNDYWMTNIPLLTECFFFLFSGPLKIILFICFMLVSVMYFLKERKTTTAFWILAGVASIFGTMFIGIVVSRLFRPLFIVRYLYPVSIIAWLILSLGLSKLKGYRYYAIALTIVVLIFELPEYKKVYSADKEQAALMEETIDSASQIITDDTIIITDLQFIDWMVADYYYPENECILLDSSAVFTPDSLAQYILITSPNILPQELLPGFLGNTDAEIEYSCIIMNGSLGTNPVSMYIIRFL